MTVPVTLTLQEIAAVARVQRPVVSMWRRRPRVHGQTIPFPKPVNSDAGLERFDRAEVLAYLDATGRGNNPEAHLDAPTHTAPIVDLEEAVTTLCLRRLSERELTGLDADALASLAEQTDPSDRLLLREIRAMPHSEQVCAYVEDVLEASLGHADALTRLLSGPLGRHAGGRGLTTDCLAAVRALALACRDHLPTDAVALSAAGDHELLRVVAPQFAGLVVPDNDPASRQQRRRAILDDIPVLDQAPMSVHLRSLVGVPDDVALDDLDELVLSLGPADVALVVGSVSLLAEAMSGELDQRRSMMLRSGTLAMAVRLPRGWWKGAHRQALAAWVLSGRAGIEQPRLADVSAADSEGPVAVEGLAHDAAAALARSDHRAFRYARAGSLKDLLARGPIVPAGVRAVRFVDPAASPLERIHEATLRSAHPMPGWSLDVLPAPARVHLRWTSLAQLHQAGLLRMRRGQRIDPAHGDPDGTVPVVTADGATPVRLDPFDAARLYPRATRTEPGDVVFVERPHPAAWVDTLGGGLVCAPSRVLRLGAATSVGPHTIAAIINQRSPAGSGWQTWAVPDLPGEEATALDDALASAAAHLRDLERRRETMQGLVTTLIDAVAAGAVTVVVPEQHAHDSRAGRRPTEQKAG